MTRTPRPPKPKVPKAPSPLPTIIIDTREQQPYTFDDARCAAVTRKLDTGDYSVEGCETYLSVERKSLDDFVGSITSGRARFFREVERLRALMFARVVIEASIGDVLAQRYTSKATPASVLGTATAIEVDFGVPVQWAGDRVGAREYVERFLLRVAKRGGGLTAGPGALDAAKAACAESEGASS